MELAFPWPFTQGEWLAWTSAVITAVFGLAMLFAPGLVFRVLRLQTHPNYPEAISAARAPMAGFHLGVGLGCILLAQPLLYLTLGLCWGLTAFGRVVSMLSDKGNTLVNWLWLIIEAGLAGLALVFALGLVA